MFINKVSPSKIKAYIECKKKYKFRYIDKLYGMYNKNSNTDALQFGSFIHKVFEDGVDAKTFEELERVAGELRSNYKFPTKKDSEVPNILKNFLRMNLKIEESVSTEQVFSVKLGDDFEINGIIDRIVKGKTGKYLVIDYKTSRVPATPTDLYKDPQMLMYTYAVSVMYGVKIEDIAVAHYYPHLDKLVSVSYKNLQIVQFLKTLKAKIWEIRKKKAEDFPAQQNQWCNWCQYKGLCPEFGGTHLALNEAKNKEKEKRRKRKPKVTLGSKPSNKP